MPTSPYPFLAAFAIATVAAVAPAAAQPEPPSGAPVAVARVARPFYRFGVGLHLGGMGVASEQAREAGEGPETELGIVGVQARWRFHRRWEVELGLSAMSGEVTPGGSLRESGGVTLGGMFHLNPDHYWLWSILFGVGGTHDTISVEKGGEKVVTAEFAESMGRLGVGVERRFDRIGFAAQFYLVGLERDDEKLDGPDYVGREGGPVPARSSGGLFQLTANYYF